MKFYVASLIAFVFIVIIAFIITRTNPGSFWNKSDGKKKDIHTYERLDENGNLVIKTEDNIYRLSKRSGRLYKWLEETGDYRRVQTDREKKREHGKIAGGHVMDDNGIEKKIR